jgi:hypothetical protein
VINHDIAEILLKVALKINQTGLTIFYFISMEGLDGQDKMKPIFCFKSFYAGMTVPFY